MCESYIGKPIGTRAVPQFTTGVAKPLTQIEPGKTEHHPVSSCAVGFNIALSKDMDMGRGSSTANMEGPLTYQYPFLSRVPGSMTNAS